MSVIIETSLGDITVDLYVNKCPNANVQKDLLTRVVNLDQQQGTCILPNQQYFRDEIFTNILHNKFGLLSTWNVGPHLNNSNFFITLTSENITKFNGRHTIFGEVVEGLEILQKINQVYLDNNNRPLTNIRILHTLIIDDPFDDFEGIQIPQSPQRVMASDRLEYEEPVLPERNVEEVIKQTKQLQVKTWSNMLEMIQDIPDADMKLPENILFVCKLNPCTTETDLELIFGRFGSIRSCEVVRDWKTGDSLGYSFIEFETDKACEEGINIIFLAYWKMENSLIDERRIHVDFSQSAQKLWPKYFKRYKKLQDDEPQLKIKNRDSGKYKMVFKKSQEKSRSRSQNNQKKKSMDRRQKVKKQK